MEISQQEIKRIYDNAMIKRSQKEQEIQQRLQEDIENNFWKYAYTRIETILKQIMTMYQTPTIPKEKIDQAQKEFSEFLDLINMNTLPEVINELIYRESKAKFQAKLKEEKQ